MLALLACPVAAQQTWLVRTCPGVDTVHFTDLPAAVAAAAPGDTIRLLSGSCPHFAPTAIDKPLTIVGVGGFGPWFDWSEIGGLMQITGLQAGERVVLRGLTFLNPHQLFASGPSFGIDASNCAGDIILDRCMVDSRKNGGATARFVNCTNVVMHDCEMALGENPIELTNSSAHISNSWIRHVSPWTMTLYPAFSGSPAFTNNSYGLKLVNATATVNTSIVTGGSAFSDGIWSWVEKAAVHLTNSTLNVGPEALIIGGGSPPTAGYLTGATGNEQVYLDPRGVLSVLPGLPHTQPVAREFPSTMYNRAAPGETFEYLIAGPPNGFAVIAFGNYQSPALPTSFGDLHLDPFTMIGIGCHPLDNLGNYLGTMFVPSGVGSSLVYGLQSLTLAPAGQLALTTATNFILGWQANLSPY